MRDSAIPKNLHRFPHILLMPGGPCDDELKQVEFADYSDCGIGGFVRDDIMYRMFTGCCVLAVAGFFSGCAGNPFKSASLTNADDALAAVAAQGESPTDMQAPKYRVTIFANGAKPQPRDFVYSGGLTMNDAVEQSGARDQFGRMMLDLVRTGRDGARHKMEIKTNKRSGRIEPLYDYAVRPGDHIMITEDNTTDLGRMLDELNPF